RLREWLKDTLPNADWQRLNPNHSFRHWLISECRRAKIDSDHARVITGHGFKDSHGKYGPADIPTLYEELALIPSPLDAAPPRTEGRKKRFIALYREMLLLSSERSSRYPGSRRPPA